MKVARHAAAKDLSYRALRRVVAEERAQMPRADSRGRPRTPLVLKTVSRALKLFGPGGSKRGFSKSEIESLDEQQKRNAKTSAEELIGKLEDLIGKLG